MRPGGTYVIQFHNNFSLIKVEIIVIKAKHTIFPGAFCFVWNGTGDSPSPPKTNYKKANA